MGYGMSFDGFWDENNLLHVKKGEYTENGVLFTAHYIMLQKLLGQEWFDRLPKKVIKPNFFDPNPSDDNVDDVHFSHDNMTGMYSMIGGGFSLPIYRWNKRWWLHPRDTIFYSIMHENKLFYIFLPVIALMAWISCRKERKDTSGKCLWWLRLQTMKNHKSKLVSIFGSKLLASMGNLIQKEHGWINPWVDVFSIYFKEKDHPINIKMREFYK